MNPLWPGQNEVIVSIGFDSIELKLFRIRVNSEGASFHLAWSLLSQKIDHQSQVDFYFKCEMNSFWIKLSCINEPDFFKLKIILKKQFKSNKKNKLFETNSKFEEKRKMQRSTLVDPKVQKHIHEISMSRLTPAQRKLWEQTNQMGKKTIHGVKFIQWLVLKAFFIKIRLWLDYVVRQTLLSWSKWWPKWSELVAVLKSAV